MTTFLSTRWYLNAWDEGGVYSLVTDVVELWTQSLIGIPEVQNAD